MAKKPIDLEVEYWNLIFGIIDSAGAYAWAIKLKKNLDDEVPEAKKFFKNHPHYHGDRNLLDRTIRNRKEKLKGMVEKNFNPLATSLGFTPINNANKFIELMLDGNRRKAYRRIFERHQFKCSYPSFQEVEMEYLKNRRGPRK